MKGAQTGRPRYEVENRWDSISEDIAGRRPWISHLMSCNRAFSYQWNGNNNIQIYRALTSRLNNVWERALSFLKHFINVKFIIHILAAVMMSKRLKRKFLSFWSLQLKWEITRHRTKYIIGNLWTTTISITSMCSKYLLKWNTNNTMGYTISVNRDVVDAAVECPEELSGGHAFM